MKLVTSEKVKLSSVLYKVLYMYQLDTNNLWMKLVNSRKVKLSPDLDTVAYRLYLDKHSNFCKWIDYIKVNFNNLGLSNIWSTQGGNCNVNWFKKCVKQNIYRRGKQLYLIPANVWATEYLKLVLIMKSIWMFYSVNGGNCSLNIDVGISLCQ